MQNIGDREIRLGELRFEDLVQSLPHPIFTVTSDGHCDFVSARYVEYTGLSVEHLLNVGWLDTIHLDDRPRMLDAWMRTNNGSSPEVRSPCRIRGANGADRWFDVRVVPVRDPATNNVLKWVGSCTDIHDAHEGLETLAHERDRLKRVIDTAPGVVCAWRQSPEGARAFTFVSPRIADLYGESPESLLRDPEIVRSHIHEDDIPTLDASLDQSARNIAPWREQFRVNHPTKGEIWVEGQAVPTREPDGGILWYGALTDVTARRRTDEELRTKQRMESIGQLAGGIAHDFNNLLTIIVACTDEMLSSMSAKDPNREPLHETRLAVERATSLTRDLLAFSRRQICEPKVLDLNDVVADTSRMLRRLLGEDVVLSTVLSPTTPFVKVDPGQWTSVLINLAVNARHAMPKGGTLTLTTRQHKDIAQENKIWAVLEVEDTGCGLTPEVATRIFEPFFTTKGVGKGTGLGLAVVHGIVQQSGGRIAVVKTVEGGGTTFRILLPAASESAIESANAMATAATATTTTTSAPPSALTVGERKPVVLFVEDEAAVRRAAARSLEGRGFDVVCAASAEDALTILRERAGQVDILVTDVVLPKMDGRLLVEHVTERYPAVKVLYTSGYTDDDVVRYGVSSSEVAFIQKPYTPRKLARKMREVLNAAVD